MGQVINGGAIADKPILEYPPAEEYTPDTREIQFLQEEYAKFRLCSDTRNKRWNYLDSRTVTEFINDGVIRFTTNEDSRENIEDWQARVNDPFTRNKIVAVLGRTAQLIPTTEFFDVGSEDFARCQILTDLFKHAEYVDDADEFMFYLLLEAAVKGTAVGFEGFISKEKAIREVDGYDGGGEATLKEGKLIKRKVFSSIVPLEEFYPSSVGIRKIKDMPYCFWATEMSLEKFQMEHSHYPRAKYVQANRTIAAGGERPFWKDYLNDTTPDGIVQVRHYYDQERDYFSVVANGIWLNPLPGFKPMPIPYAHKSLPFYSFIYEPFGSDFFYGKSLADKLKTLQDVLNVLHNMMLDQAFLTIFKPLLVSAVDEISDDFIRPGRRVPVSDVNAYKELDQSSPDSFHRYIMEYTKKVLEETSLDAVQSGAAGQGDRTTATEIEQAADAASAILGLFAQFVKWGVRDRARLRAKNILQFYREPLIQKILGEGAEEDVKKAFNTFKVENTTLTSGKRGTKIIDMYKDKQAMPTADKLQAEAVIASKTEGKKIEKVAITQDYIRDFEFDVRLVPNRTVQQSKALDRALVLEKAKIYLEFMPELVDKEELAMQIAQSFGDKPDKILKLNQEAPVPMSGEEMMGSQMGISQNMMKGAMGNQDTASAMRQAVK